MGKHELLISAGSTDEMIRYAEAGADAVVVGESRFAMRMPGDVTLAELRETLPALHAKGVKVYVSVNNIIDNGSVDELTAYLSEIGELAVDGIVFGDPAVLMAVRTAAPGIPLHWNAEMTSTNYVTANYWGTKGATRVVAARELNMDEVLEMKRHLNIELQVQVHGMTNIYHSKRSLLVNYREHQGSTGDKSELGQDKRLFLIEQERQDERYPIYEDGNGTHIMSADDVCMLESLHELMEGGIDSFKIESLLKSVEYNVAVIHGYRKAIDAYVNDPEGYEFQEEWLEPIRELQAEDRELSFGFFYKEQVY